MIPAHCTLAFAEGMAASFAHSTALPSFTATNSTLVSPLPEEYRSEPSPPRAPGAAEDRHMGRRVARQWGSFHPRLPHAIHMQTSHSIFLSPHYLNRLGIIMCNPPLLTHFDLLNTWREKKELFCHKGELLSSIKRGKKTNKNISHLCASSTQTYKAANWLDRYL